VEQPQTLNPRARQDSTDSPESWTPELGDRASRDRYHAVRAFSEQLVVHLDAEDLVAQSMPDASPAKWHLAHTAWFFETFVLERFAERHVTVDPRYRFLFNSYYNAVGERHARPMRGVLTRPALRDVMAYRRAVDESIAALYDAVRDEDRDEMLRTIEIGMHHEQQHQELILTDLKHLFAQNVLAPAYRAELPSSDGEAPSLQWIRQPEGIRQVGADADGFAFDNERPRHRIFLEQFALANRLVTNAEFLEFVQDDGYRRPDLWLDAGWARVNEEQWSHPCYWRPGDDGWSEFTLAGARPLAMNEPVSHVSYIEADAFARWAGARLPTEQEWEVACSALSIEGNFADSGRFHPAPHKTCNPGDTAVIEQAFGDLWEWTRSDYAPYPGFDAEPGALGEYNGKFMCGQIVLRGGSCASSSAHLRATYRNFFHPPDRWQFSGIRLAKD
jgi:ergothioneine biosynthesis protein EgtB